MFATAEQADAWIRAEAEHWVPALGDATADGDHRMVVAAVGAVTWFSSRWSHWPRWAQVFTFGYESAVALGDLGQQAEFLSSVAWTHTMPWRNARPALEYAGRALELARQAGDVRAEGKAWQYIARARKMLGDPHAALDAVRTAAQRFEQAGDADAFCQTLIGRGDIALALGQVDEALTSFQRALEMVEEPGASGMTPSIAAATLPFVLGQTARALGRAGRRDQGIPLARRAVDLAPKHATFRGPGHDPAHHGRGVVRRGECRSGARVPAAGRAAVRVGRTARGRGRLP
jgi:tetratricopeptide (TPR) repeat protein